MKLPTPTQVKPVLTKTRAIKDCATNDWSVEFEFIQQDGTKGRVLVTGDDAENVGTLRRKLNQKGAQLPKSADERKALLEGAIAAKPRKIVHQLASPGWQPHRVPWMSVGAELIGAPEGEIEYAPPALIAQSHSKAFSKRGTLDEWKSRVAAKALLSTCITISMSASFAAPLLVFVRQLNFALALYGLARTGKTTALLCSTSVFAYGLEEDLPNWNTSGARMLEFAAAFSELVFPLNEVGAARGRRKNTYEAQRDLYAQYAEGRDRDRHSSWKGGQGAAPQRFRGICISTAEHSVAEYAMMAGETRDAGELFRAIDVKAVRGDGATVLDLAPETVDQRVCLEELRTALRECHGTAFQPYVRFLQSLGRVEVEAQTRKHIETFVQNMPGTKDGVARGIAANFGLLYAGGVFAIQAKILPWSFDHLREALTRGFTDAIEASKVLEPLAMGREIFKARLAGLAQRKEGVRFGVKERAGYWTLSGGVKTYVVHTRQLGDWFPSKGLRDVTLNWLCANGLLKRAQATELNVVSSEDLKGVKRRWPDGRLVRSFVFSDPFAEPAEKAPEQPPVDPEGQVAIGAAKPRLGGPRSRGGAIKQAIKPNRSKPGAGAGKTFKPRLGGPRARTGAIKQAAKPKLAKPASDMRKPQSKNGNKNLSRPVLRSIIDYPVLPGDSSDD